MDNASTQHRGLGFLHTARSINTQVAGTCQSRVPVQATQEPWLLQMLSIDPDLRWTLKTL